MLLKINYIPVYYTLLQYFFMASSSSSSSSDSSDSEPEDDASSATSTRMPQVGEGWQRISDQKYFIVVKIDRSPRKRLTLPHVILISKGDEPVQFPFYRFTNYYSYKDRGVKADEAWKLKNDTYEPVYLTTGSVYEKVTRNGTTVWETRISYHPEEASSNISISELLRRFQHMASPLSGAASSSASTVQNDGSGGGGEATSSTTIDLTQDFSDDDEAKQRKRKRETKAELKKEGKCPVCYADIFSNKEEHLLVDRIKEQNGKLKIGVKTVKILTCCGNPIHYSCYMQQKERMTRCPACNQKFDSLRDEDRLRDPKDVKITTTKVEVDVDTVVYRLSCQLKF